MEDVAIVIVKEGPERGRRWPLERDRIVIGRSPQADVCIPDRRISSNHAEISRRDGRYYLRDLGSKNGTYVNGQLLDSECALRDGDEIHLALVVTLTFVDAGRTVPLIFGGTLEPGLKLDPQSRRVWVSGCELEPPLSQAQFRLLQLLVEADGAVCSRDEVMAAVWPGEAEEGITEQAIDALVRRLRERLAEVDPDHSYVLTVRGHGFRLEQKGV